MGGSMNMNLRTGWKRITGYRGQISHVWRDQLQICVREDSLARDRRRRFMILDYSREAARHETLAKAKLDVLQRLLEAVQ